MSDIIQAIDAEMMYDDMVTASDENG